MADTPQITRNAIVLNELASGHGDDPDTNNWKISFKADGMYITNDAGVEFGPTNSMKYIQQISTHGQGGTVDASSTRYLSSVEPGVSSNIRNIFVRHDCTIANLYVTSGAQDASGSLVFDVLVNGVTSSALTVTVAAGGASGTYSDTVHTVDLSAGDSVILRIVNNATSASGAIQACSFDILWPAVIQ